MVEERNILLGYALIPYLFTRFFLPNEEAELGGNWFSLITIHVGGALLWASIFVKDYQAVLHGAAYAMWVLSMLPIAAELWRIVRKGLARVEQAADAPLADEAETRR